MTVSCGSYTRALRETPQPARIDLDKLATLLRRFHPRNTAAEVSVRTGIPVRTVESYLGADGRMPSSVSLIRLIAAYGTDILVILLPEAPAWLSQAHRDARRIQLEQEIAIAKLALERVDSDGGKKCLTGG